MKSAYVLHVAAENTFFNTGRPQHVVRHHQQVASASPFRMAGDDIFQILNATGRRVSFKNKLQNGHEMAFPAAEASMEVAGFALVLNDSSLDESQCIVKCLYQLICRNVRGCGRFRMDNTFGQVQNKLPLVQVFRDIDQFFQESHWAVRRYFAAMLSGIRHDGYFSFQTIVRAEHDHHC